MKKILDFIKYKNIIECNDIHSDKLKMKGNLVCKLYKENGTIEIYEMHNMIVSSGINLFIDAISNNIGGHTSSISKMSIGSDKTPVTIHDSRINAELASKNTTYELNRQAHSVTFTALFDKNVGTGTIFEFGLLNSNNILFDRIVLDGDGIKKGANDILEGIIEISFSNG